MEIASRNFGERLRGLIEQKRQSNRDFADAYGITESQLYNWLNREAPPLHKHWQKLADYFGCSVDYVAFGSPIIEERTGDMMVEEPQAHYLPSGAGGLSDSALAITEQIQSKVFAVVRAANGDPSRLGWINEQLDQHLRPPATWPKVAPKPALDLPPLTSSSARQQPARQRDAANG